VCPPSLSADTDKRVHTVNLRSSTFILWPAAVVVLPRGTIRPDLLVAVGQMFMLLRILAFRMFMEPQRSMEYYERHVRLTGVDQPSVDKDDRSLHLIVAQPRESSIIGTRSNRVTVLQLSKAPME
jgi:hypothetical protein